MRTPIAGPVRAAPARDAAGSNEIGAKRSTINPTASRSSPFSTTIVPKVTPTGRPSCRISPSRAISPIRIGITRLSIWLIISTLKWVDHGRSRPMLP